MPDAAARIGNLADRISNRLIWKLAPKTRPISTDGPLVSFTFDDVPDTALTHGAAILERHGLRGTFYIAGGLEGRVEPDRTLISSDGCRTLFENGHEIGCHTFGHRRLRAYPPGALSADLDRNAAYLRAAGISRAPTSFAFPYNAAWPLSRRALSRRYQTCRGAGEAVNRGEVDPLMLKSVEIRQPERHARDLTRWVDDLIAEPGWLIFFTHDIAENPTPYGCTPETFEHLVRYCVERGCRVRTVRDATAELGWHPDADGNAG